MPTPIARLLIVDDEAAQMKALCATLETEGYSTTGFTSAHAALGALEDQVFDLVLSDLMMPEMDGIALLHAATEIDPCLVGIVMTGHGTIHSAVEAMQTGALDYILKPFKLSAILPIISRALAVRRLRMENLQLQESVGIYKLSMGIAFASGIDTVLSQVADAGMAQSRVGAVSVLLPTPDGRELYVAVARGSHSSIEGARTRLDNAISGWVEYRRELLLRQDEPAESQFISAAPLGRLSADVSIPMLAGGRFVGILNLMPTGPRRALSAGQVKALNILAGTAAAAIERVSLVERLWSAEQRYRRLAENAPDIVFRYELHPQPGFSYVNPVVREITGYTAEEHYEDPDLGLRMVHPADRPILESLLRGEYSSGCAVTLRYRHRDGNTIWLEHRAIPARDDDGRLMAVEGIARDITERRALEEQLRQSQKMEAIGLLAGGVAHDFNNQLTIINGYSQLILVEDEPSASIVDKVDQIMKAGDHAAVLTRQLLAFGRRQMLQPRVLDLNAIVESAMKMLRRVIGEHIELLAHLQSGLGLVKVDPAQVEQILMNLAVNSRDAMPQGGTFTIATRDAGSDVVLTVSDTGCGMDAATQSRIFEPFFTTKEPGRGTGLGLAIVYGAVKQSEGSIRLFSEPGKGAEFEITLPRANEAGAQPSVEDKKIGIRKGSETILVVEDDEGVRRLVCGTLRKSGYRVLHASDGQEAFEIYQESDLPIALILTDLVMPRMSGTALVEKLKEINRAVRVLFMSGYAEHPVVAGNYRDSGIPFLQKPFSSENLLAAVREELDREATMSA